MKGTRGRGNRHSMGSYKEDTTNSGFTKNEDQINKKNGNAVSKITDEVKSVDEISKFVPTNLNGQNMDIFVQS